MPYGTRKDAEYKRTRDQYEGDRQGYVDSTQDNTRLLGLYKVKRHGNTTMLNAGRMKHASKVDQQRRSATQPWKKSQSRCILRGLWHLMPALEISKFQMHMSMLFTISSGPWCETQVEERLDVHHWVIAWEVPIIVHAGTCTKQKRYEDDWKEL
ncbi:hypothetical protein BDR04DRAFT_1123479 [Suillus decipiens]|nr:hypothetical protein BDR04DRAFT_1123479 [Suillus decipiens]